MDPVRGSHSKQLTNEQVVQKLPEELRRQSLSGSLPVSFQALRVGLSCCSFFPLVKGAFVHSVSAFLLMCIERQQTYEHV